MNEMTASAQEVARNAGAAAEAAHNAEAEAQKGRKVVEGAVGTIRALAEEVARASDVIQRVKGDTVQIGSGVWLSNSDETLVALAILRIA
mgnify:CR=1 FL=1